MKRALGWRRSDGAETTRERHVPLDGCIWAQWRLRNLRGAADCTLTTVFPLAYNQGEEALHAEVAELEDALA